MNDARLSRRYPGVTPFEREQEHLFFGRDREIADLLRLCALERLLVLFGKSGHGKSSLLNAGLLPKLPMAFRGKTCIPIVIRLGAYARGESLPPREALLAELERACPPAPGTEFYESLPTGRTLWREFKRRQIVQTSNASLQTSFVLLFDQFEEFFLYPPEHQQQFRQELSELLYTEIPQAAFHEFDRLGDSEQDHLSAPLDVHTMFAIRSDRLHLLDSMKQELPDILRKRYELRGLSAEQAEAAMVLPAAAADARFDTLPFRFEAEALQRITQALSRGDSGEEAGRIESFQLQIVCQSIEDAVRARNRRGETTVTVAAADLPDFEKIFENYYAARIASLADPARERAARLLLEEELLYADEAKGEARRLSMDGDALVANLRAKHGLELPPALLDALVNAFLVRREQTARGTHYEISHDTLMGAMLAAREERRREEREAAERERLRAEAERQKAEREKIARARRRNAFFTAAALLLLGWALWSAYNASRKTRLAEAKTLEAERADSVARAAIDTAALKTRYAQLQEKQARAALSAAEAAELRAMQEQAKANAAKAEAVGGLLKDAKSDILHLDFAAAKEKLFKAADLGVRSREVGLALMEPAFWYIESEQTDKAAPLLTRTASLLNKPVPARPANRAAAEKNLQALDGKRYAALQQLYYPNMLPIPAGRFWMGCDSTRDKNCSNDERPRHEVQLAAFRLAETETTMRQYGLYCAAKGLDIRDFHEKSWELRGDAPVIYVSWYQAILYANWLSAQFGLEPAYDIVDVEETDGAPYFTAVPRRGATGYRLPAEAEWEYAARGNEGYRYAGSDDLDAVAWSAANSNRTNPVQGKNANGFGLYDMSGNVWEWCWDWYEGYVNTENLQVNPTGPDKGACRVGRGGSWGSGAENCRVSGRGRWYPVRRDNLGFRLASFLQ